MHDGPGVLKGATAAERRHDAVYRVFREYVTHRFAALPEARSALLLVAQYWCDEAWDAVHAEVVFSRAECPAWPIGGGSYDGDESPGGSPLDIHLHWGDPGYELLRWDDNGTSIEAFELYCTEDGSQEESSRHLYRPFAWARRDGDEVQIEVVGQVVRADADRPAYVEPEDDEEDSWSRTPVDQSPRPAYVPPAGTEALFAGVLAEPDDDARRKVLADALLERGDPRGEAIAAELRGDYEVVHRLVAEHGPSWMGPLQRVVGWTSADFRLGFLDSAHVLLDDDAPLDDATWNTVRHLSFRSDSPVRFPSGLRRLHTLALGGSQLAPRTPDGLRASHLVVGGVAEAQMAGLQELWRRLGPQRLTIVDTVDGSERALVERLRPPVARYREALAEDVPAWLELARALGLEGLELELVEPEDADLGSVFMLPRMHLRYTPATRSLRLVPPPFCELEACLVHAQLLLTYVHGQVARVELESSPRYDCRRYLDEDAAWAAPRREALRELADATQGTVGAPLELV